MSEADDTLTIATSQLRVTVHQPLWLEWSYRDEAGEWQTLANDRPTSAYLANAHGMASPIILAAAKMNVTTG